MSAAWYERSFGADYMVVYRHRDWEQAAREAQKMAGWLELPEHARVLDIGCGTGRHALALCEMGYNVTGVDLSDALLDEARSNNADHCVRFVRGDMRHLPFQEGEFHATVNLFTSFGYFRREADDLAVLHEIRRVLRPDGQFLIDFLNPSYVRDNLVPYSERTDEETGLLIQETRKIEGDWVVKQIQLSKEGEQSRMYEERVELFPLAWFEQRLLASGLKLERAYGGYDGRPYEEQTSERMIMTGRVGK